MNTPKVQKRITKTNFFSGKDFLRASKLANELEFTEIEVSEDTSPGNNYFGLFIADNNAYWSITMVENGKYHLECDGTKVCVIDTPLENQLDKLRAYELEEPERRIQEELEFQAYQDELWRDYGNNF